MAKDRLSAPAFVYMVRCADGTLYTGITYDTARRLRQHNGEIAGGAKYTATRRPVSLAYREECGTWSEAMRRERAIKKLSRTIKLRLCKEAA